VNEYQAYVDEQRKKYRKWQHRVRAGLPKLASRVFALRAVSYPGYGFHYGMERSLGRVIALVSDYGRYLDAADIVIDQIVVADLYRDVAKAEASALTGKNGGHEA